MKPKRCVKEQFLIIHLYWNSSLTSISPESHYPSTMEFVIDQSKTREMCQKAVLRNPYLLEDVSDKYKTREMCKMFLNATEEVREIPYWSTNPLMLEKGRGCCELSITVPSKTYSVSYPR